MGSKGERYITAASAAYLNKAVEPTGYSLTLAPGGSPLAFGFIHRESRKLACGRFEETTMWYRAVGSIVILILSLLALPLAAVAQPAGKGARIGVLLDEFALPLHGVVR